MKVEIEKVENGYVVNRTFGLEVRKMVFKSFEELMNWLKEYFQEAISEQ